MAVHWLLHMEFQGRRSPAPMSWRMLEYNDYRLRSMTMQDPTSRTQMIRFLFLFPKTKTNPKGGVMSMFKRLFGSKEERNKRMEAELHRREEQIEAELAKITQERIRVVKSPDGRIDLEKTWQQLPRGDDIIAAYEEARQSGVGRFFKTGSTRAKSPLFREAELARELGSIREQLAEMSKQDKR